mmetsp:Transcript_18989/g.58449  ORF Transcript_18989/g.58449 Transcript_18989/m.58449 type:complete len:336 (+) Transcript_18989:446-1453(+)
MLRGESRVGRRRGLGHPVDLGRQGRREEGHRLRVHGHGRPREAIGRSERPLGHRRSATIGRRDARAREGLRGHHRERVDGLLPAERVDARLGAPRARQLPQARRRDLSEPSGAVLGARRAAGRARREAGGNRRGHGGLGRVRGRDDARARRRRPVSPRALRGGAGGLPHEAGRVGGAAGRPARGAAVPLLVHRLVRVHEGGGRGRRRVALPVPPPVRSGGGLRWVVRLPLRGLAGGPGGRGGRARHVARGGLHALGPAGLLRAAGAAPRRVRGVRARPVRDGRDHRAETPEGLRAPLRRRRDPERRRGPGRAQGCPLVGALLMRARAPPSAKIHE